MHIQACKGSEFTDWPAALRAGVESVNLFNTIDLFEQKAMFLVRSSSTLALRVST